MNSTTEVSAHDRILAERARYVSAGVSTPKLVVSHADGARVTDVDGRTFIDFAGGIGCQNTGHRFAPVVDAIKAQADEYLHQCFMVGVYEPYVEVCRRLAELSPCAGERAEVDPPQLGRRGGRERSQDRALGDRPAGGRRLRQRLPRPHAADDDDDGEGEAVQGRASGRSRPRSTARPVPNPYRGITTDDAIAGLKQLFKADVDPATVACAVLEPVQGEGGFLPMPRDYLLRLQELCREHGILYVDDEVQSGVGRTGKMWAIEHYDGVAPDLLVSRQVDRRRPAARGRHRRRVDHGRRPARRARRHLRRQPTLVRGRDRGARRGRRAGVPASEATALGEHAARRGSTRWQAKHDAIGEVRGLGPMLAFELAEQAPEQASAIVAAAFERGLLLLSCGMYGNVIRLLAPLTIDDADARAGPGAAGGVA